MKIVFFGNSMTHMLHFRWSIIEWLAQTGHHIFVIAPMENKEIASKYQQRNIEFLHIDNTRGLYRFKDKIKGLVQYRKLIKKISPHLIFSYSINQSLYSRIINWKVTNANFITGLGSGFISKRHRIWIWSILFSLRCFEKIMKRNDEIFIFLNPSDKEYFIKYKLCNKKHCKTFPGEGVDLEEYTFSPIHKHATTISFLFIGRLIKDKGIIELMTSCKTLLNDAINFQCTVISPPDAYNPSSLKNINPKDFKACGINYIPHADDVRPYIKSHDVLVLPSYGEGLPRVLLEAMAIGRPIITTNVNGCKELVKKNGLLVNPRDTQSLYQAMLEMAAKNGKELNKFAISGHSLLKEKYAISCVKDNYLSLLNNIPNKG